MEKLNLYQKLHDIESTILGLGKDKSATNYKYVTGDKVLSEIKPLMVKHKLLLKQEIISIENVRQDYIVGFNSANQRTKSEILSKVMMRFTWVDADTGEKDENLFGANGQNDWDKGIGSALTYGERYFLLKYFHIATDEDDIDNPDRKPDEKPIEGKKVTEPTTQQKVDAMRKVPPADVAPVTGDTVFEEKHQTAISAAPTTQILTLIWNQHKALQQDEKFIAAIKDRRTQLTAK
jgi:ERF superfamily